MSSQGSLTNSHMVTLGDVCDIESGVGFPTTYQGNSTGDYPVAKVSDISMAVIDAYGDISTAANYVTSEVASELGAKVFPVGSVLFAKIGEAIRLNRRAFVKVPILADNNVMGVIPHASTVEALYLRWFMETVDLYALTQTTAVPSIRKSDVAAITIPLPPLYEQRRIAAILERADRVRRLCRYALELGESYLQAVFLEMFGDPVTNPMGWEVIPLGKLGEVQGGLQLSHKRNAHELKLPYLRVANVYRNQLVLSEIKFIGLTEDEFERTRLQANDILIVEGHGNSQEIGRCAIWDGSIDPCVHQNHLIRVRPNQQVALAVYLSYFINGTGGKGYFHRASNTTSGLNTISTSTVKRCPVPLPNHDLQNQFAGVVHQFDRVRTQQREQLRQAEHLFVSLLDRAFRGEV